ncbi:MAG TPA: hypothetical protein VJ739_16620 [Gemmataceae bacterium]|nr:hypothetical protein [Gemmataceae bacterium]
MGSLSTLSELQRRVEALERRSKPPPPVLAKIRRDPASLMTLTGKSPDRWQAELLRCSDKHLLMTCARQTGKSTTAAALVTKEALLCPGSLTLLLSPSARQSGEIFQKVMAFYGSLGRPVPTTRESALQMQLANGSRVVALPADESKVRCFSSVRLLVIDEAARTPEELYLAVRPMLAVSGGRLVCLSTPFGRIGWFWREWSQGEDWRRVSVRATDCPRIPRAFLDEEKRTMGPRWYAQEYENSFEAAVDAVFNPLDIEAALGAAVRPLFAVR